MSDRISADVGGMFTDVVVTDAAGTLTAGKRLTTPGLGLLHRDSVQIDMQRTPFLVRSLPLVTGSARAGRQRGGLVPVAAARAACGAASTGEIGNDTLAIDAGATAALRAGRGDEQ